MSNYSIALFLHIVGVMGFVVTLGLEWIALSQIRRATLTEEARGIMGVIKATNLLGFISMPTIILTGIYMMLNEWGFVGWIIVTLGALALETVLFVALAAPRVAAIERALVKEKGALSQDFHSLANNPLLWLSIQTRVAIVIGIVFLKITHPYLERSLLFMGIAIMLGLASTLPVLRRERTQAGLADRTVL